MSTRRAIATIDIGTNTSLLLIARPSELADVTGSPGSPEVLENAADITRLGRGIGGGGRLGQEGIAMTLAALTRFAERIHQRDADVFAIGTEALRRAPNADDFLIPARAILGCDVEVISGEREAELTFRAVAESFPEEIADGKSLIVDIGGGSTEIVVVDTGRIVRRASLPLGSVRLTERHVRHDPPIAEEIASIRGDIARTIAQSGALAAPPPAGGGGAGAGGPARLIGVAGTVTSLMAMALALPTYAPERVHGARLSLEALDLQISRLVTANQESREGMAGLDPRRADVIFAGALILRELARLGAVDEVRVSDRGIRWGLFFERAAARGRDARGGRSDRIG